MKIVAVIQARMGSTRLPGKTLEDIEGLPVLGWVIERLLRCKSLDSVVVATSDRNLDDAIAKFSSKMGVGLFRGSEDDVLDRFYRAALTTGADHIVRITADCPFVDPEVVDAVCALQLSGNYDYSSNVHPPTYPDGFDVEVMKMDVLESAWREATRSADRMHVTSFIAMNSERERFRMGNLTCSIDVSDLRLTVDEPEDLILLRDIASELGSRTFSCDDVVALLKSRPDLVQINASCKRNEGFETDIALGRKDE